MIKVRLLDRLSRDIVAFQAEARLALNQMEDAFGRFGRLSGVHRVASAAVRMRDSLLVQKLRSSMAAEAKIFAGRFALGRHPQKLVSTTGVGVMAGRTFELTISFAGISSRDGVG